MAAPPIPDNVPTMTPTTCIRGCDDAIAFYWKVFGAEEIERYSNPDGTVAHAELKIGDSIFMLGEAAKISPWHMTVRVYVRDCDATFKRAVDAGAKVLEPLTDEFYGDRNGRVRDPFGNTWIIATHKEDVSPAEMQRQFKAMTSGGPAA
ncbi:MAG TPA: VOC family protein [Planctomycetota bacterium]|jgi:PhnB protein|nr:VOC family protein [Planctomycetota bacterium]